MLSMLAATPALAKKHPIMLDANTDATKCIECHSDTTKGKVQHSAIVTQCMTCHELRVTKYATYVKLVTATPVKLCLQCHTDKDASQMQGRVHPPAVRDCLTCHDPHSSENANLLVKPTSGATKDDNLCLTCHDKGLNVPKGGSRHPALDAGCDTCHVTHKTGPSSDLEFKFHLAKAAPALCVDCHNVDDPDLAKAHRNQPFEKANCLECHDPHQSDRPKLMQKFVHVPFDGKMCDMCHQPAKDGKVVLTQATPKEICVTCHDDKAKQIETATVQHPGALGDCTDCHSPHAGTSPAFLKPDPVTVCLTCHTERADEMKKRVLHQPAFEQGCGICHDAHGNNNQNLLRAQGNALCLECHGPDSVPQKVEGEHLLSIFGGTVKLPDDYYKKNRVPILPLKYGLGHPVDGHPVSDVMNPTDVTKVKVHLTCLSCHQPHASANPGLLVKDQEDNMAFCDNCHKNRITMGVQ